MVSNVFLIFSLRFTFSLSALWYYVQRLQSNCVYVFSRVVKINFRSNTSGRLAGNVKWAMQVGSEKGASSWLATLPITEHRFALHKGAFQDALCLWSSWQPSHLPSHCIYGQHFNVEHALICTRGGIPFNLPQWAEGHNGWVPHWSVSQCRNWATTSTTHRWTSYTRISKQGGWGRLDIAADNWERDQNHAFLKWRCSAPSQSHQNTFLSQC